ncbi:hypothetical protein B0A68_13175 [Flavobacterium reichenbachii]|uniref:Uncharacterized protein n=1 Tax=Flavobacterium reichenbachii TaxID=362418 RepID=A0A085ZSW5_9FLAO|nr:hypothetical protein IW19_19355 [Flavobacterium reichenbachii]OXB14170.1 hypothetical protein B0A68_13175 [Flavobacterium reichenbachii]
MWRISKLICLFIGNSVKWVYYGGKKSMTEVAKEDNEIIGFIIVAFIFFFFIHLTNKNIIRSNCQQFKT